MKFALFASAIADWWTAPLALDVGDAVDSIFSLFPEVIPEFYQIGNCPLFAGIARQLGLN